MDKRSVKRALSLTLIATLFICVAGTSSLVGCRGAKGDVPDDAADTSTVSGKAALEASTRYLANDVGPKGVRVNAISAGPIKTVSAMGVGGFSTLLAAMADKAPLRRNVNQGDVGNTAAFLMSPLSAGITGQVIYVDCGYQITG